MEKTQLSIEPFLPPFPLRSFITQAFGISRFMPEAKESWDRVSSEGLKPALMKRYRNSEKI
jgi:hypothetical protein